MFFPACREFDGCRRLMGEIVREAGLPARSHLAGGLLARGQGRPDYCGTVQGIRDRMGLGAIQNLGIAPEHRNAGLGTSLLCTPCADSSRRVSGACIWK